MAGKADLAAAVFRSERIIFDRNRFAFSFGIIYDRQLHRVQHCHHTRSGFVQILAKAAFQERPVHGGIHLGNTDPLTEGANCLRSIAAAPQSAKGGHPGIIPTGNAAFFHQPAKLALAHDGVINTETRKFDLPRLAGDVGVVDDPVVKRAVRLILQRTERVGDALQRVLDRVSKIVHREDAPFGSLTVMFNIPDAVDDRIAHVEIAAGKIDFCAQSVFSFREFAVFHPFKQIEIFRNRTLTVGADGGLANIAAVFPELFGGQLANVG